LRNANAFGWCVCECAFDARGASLRTPQRRSDAFCHTARSLFRTQILISSLASLSCKTASRLFLPYFLRHAIVKKQTPPHTNTHSNRPCVSPFLRAENSSVLKRACKSSRRHTQELFHTSLAYFQFAVKKHVMLFL
jgi:hypothetical protein